jgi:hypothetical protein
MLVMQVISRVLILWLENWFRISLNFSNSKLGRKKLM